MLADSAFLLRSGAENSFLQTLRDGPIEPSSSSRTNMYNGKRISERKSWVQSKVTRIARPLTRCARSSEFPEIQDEFFFRKIRQKSGLRTSCQSLKQGFLDPIIILSAAYYKKTRRYLPVAKYVLLASMILISSLGLSACDDPSQSDCDSSSEKLEAAGLVATKAALEQGNALAAAQLANRQDCANKFASVP